jgi:hypothetical protein
MKKKLNKKLEIEKDTQQRKWGALSIQEKGRGATPHPTFSKQPAGAPSCQASPPEKRGGVAFPRNVKQAACKSIWLQRVSI